MWRLYVIAIGIYMTAALGASYVVFDYGPWWLPAVTIYAMTSATGFAYLIMKHRNNKQLVS